MSERARKRILDRIRAVTSRLDVPYPQEAVRASEDPRLLRAGQEELIALFGQRQEELGGRLQVAATAEQLMEVLASRLREVAEGPIWIEPGLQVGGTRVIEALRRAEIGELHEAILPTEGRHWKEVLEDASVGITGADFLLAQTGSVVLVHRDGRPRSLSLLPPTHFVVASAEQLLPDLDAAVPLLKGQFGEPDFPAVTVITGSSRTADIEKILIRGVHGPQNLEVFLLAKRAD